MERRRFLGALAGMAVGGGCTRPADAPRDVPNRTDTTDGTDTAGPTTVSVPADAYDALGYDLPAPAGEYPYRPSPVDATLAQRTVGPYHLAVATDAAEARALAGHLGTPRDADPAGFLDATAFDGAVVVLVRDLHASSSPDLAVRGVRRGPSWVDLDLEYPGRGGTADLAEEVLLVRVPRGGDDPEHATVALADGPAFSTVGRYGRERLDPPRDVVVRNRDCTAYDLSIRATVGDELVYARGHDEYAPASLVRHRGALVDAGEYRIVVDYYGGARTATLETTLEPDGDRGVLVDVDGNGNASVRAVPAAELPADAPGTCEASDLPYESSDPAENLDEAVDVQWANHSDAEETVDLRVRDGDRIVVERTLTLSAGSKGRTEPLIGKRGIYHVTLEREDRTRTVRWDVRKGPLQLLVQEDGQLQVATSSLAD